MYYITYSEPLKVSSAREMVEYPELHMDSHHTLIYVNLYYLDSDLSNHTLFGSTTGCLIDNNTNLGVSHWLIRSSPEIIIKSS